MPCYDRVKLYMLNQCCTLFLLLSIEYQRASVNTMLMLSHATGSCGKRCLVCAVEENRCGRCRSFRADHCKCGVPDCPLQHHKYDRARNSHAYSEKMLFRSCGRSDEALIWDATKDQVRKPSTCTWHFLCVRCERNRYVSALEGRICERHDAEYYHNSEKPIPEGHIHQEDVTVLRVFTYRALPHNTDVHDFLVTLNQQESPKVVRVLMTLLQAFDDAKKQCSASQPGSSGHLRSCEEGMLFAYDLSDKGHQIEFPFFCEVDLTASRLGHHWLVYGQMPPYYWAFPVDTDKADDLQLHFRSIIKSVNSQLVQEREEYYQRYSEAKEKCSEAKRKCGPIKLIVGYLCRLDKYCIKVRVEFD